MSSKKPTMFSDHDVRVRAYRIWEKSGRPEGCADEHWRQALAELEAEDRAAVNAAEVAHVPPHLEVSNLPTRTAATAISGLTDPLKKAG
jgi:hypothetical protein